MRERKRVRGRDSERERKTGVRSLVCITAIKRGREKEAKTEGGTNCLACITAIKRERQRDSVCERESWCFFAIIAEMIFLIVITSVL